MNRFAPKSRPTPPRAAAVVRDAPCAGPFRGATAALVLMIGLLAGTASTALADAKARSEGKPGNFYRSARTLPEDVQRVLVLPLTCEADRSDLADGCDALELILPEELAKTRKFELVRATPQTVRFRTGKAAWDASAVLSQKFFESLRDAYGCDAVLFCQLTAFRAYPPLAVGWRMRLVDARSKQTLWASDEVFEATQRFVKQRVRRIPWLVARECPGPQTDDWLALNSPRRFGQLSLAAVLATLPNR